MDKINKLKPLVSKADILNFIPQKPPMAMIDCLFEVGEKRSLTGFEVRASNIFCKNGFLQSPALVENMAQTAAIHSGYLSQKAGLPPPVGFIGAVKKLTVHRLPKIGDQLVSEMFIDQVIMNFTMIRATVKLDGELLAECEMKIFTQKTPNS